MKRVANLKIMGCWGMLSIIAALPLPMLAASTASQPAQTPAPKSTVLPVAPSPAKPATSLPSAAVKAPPISTVAVPPQPVLQLRLIPQKEIFSSREGLVMRFIFTAKAKTKLCLDKDILSQMQVSIFQSGLGKLPLKPLVIKDNSQLFMEPMRVVWLDAGQSFTVRANLKRFQLDGGLSWQPGEYNADATFNLCEQTPVEPVTEAGRETPIKAARQSWFMIME